MRSIRSLHIREIARQATRTGARAACAARCLALLCTIVRVLFLENEDSFTWNVVESLPFPRRDVCLRSGAPSLWAATRLLASAPWSGPGPTDPLRAGIVDIILAVARARLPLLGICLGHQALGLAYGARLVRVHPAHGKRSTIRFSRSRLFPSIQGSRVVMRYHSLALAAVREPLRVVAQTRDGIPMAIEHETLPMAGLQFHPDSYGTPRGLQMVADFFQAVA